MAEKNISKYSNIDENVSSILSDFKNEKKNLKEVSIELEKIYKNEFTSFGAKKVYARYGITRSGKILIDFKKNGRPVSLSINECEKLNNILSSRNFENYIKSKKDIINERNQEYFSNLNKQRENKKAEHSESTPAEHSESTSAEHSESTPAEHSESTSAEHSESTPAEHSESTNAEHSESTSAEHSESTPSE